MKINLILFLLLFSFGTFGQSAKKLNKELRAQLLVEQQRQDSAHQKFLVETTILEQVRKDMEAHIKTSLYTEDKKLRKVHSSITTSLNTLKNLEIPGTDVFPNGVDFDSHLKYKTFIKPLDEALGKYVKFDIVIMEFRLEDYKVKEQNELLKEQIQKYQTYAKYNLVHLQDQRDYIQQITSFHPRIDSLSQVYQSLNSDLEKKSELLLKKIETARENYRLKGPEGFPLGYGFVFPEIHPIPREVENTEIIGDFDAGPVVEAPPVEKIKGPEIYDYVEEPASFPGGMPSLKKYMEDHLVYPPAAKEAGVSGKAFVKFIVSDKGTISNVMIVRGVPDCKECDAEARRLVKSMPNWIPGKNKGKAVNSYFHLPVQFKL